MSYRQVHNCTCKKIAVDTSDYTSRFIIHGVSTGFVRLSGKAWRKFESSKSTWKQTCQRRAYSIGLTGMGPFFIILLCRPVRTKLILGGLRAKRAEMGVRGNENENFSRPRPFYHWKRPFCTNYTIQMM